MADTILVLALLCFIVPWVLQTRDTLRMKSSHMNPNFGLLYVAGYLLFGYSALLSGDVVITGLLALASFLALVNFAYSLFTFWKESAAAGAKRRKR